MHTKLLSFLAVLAVGGTTGAVAYTTVSNTSPASADDGITATTPAATTDDTAPDDKQTAGLVPADPCLDPASTDPACVVVAHVSPAEVAAPAALDDDGTLDQGSGDAPGLPLQPGAPLGDRRGDGTVDDSSTGADDDDRTWPSRDDDEAEDRRGRSHHDDADDSDHHSDVSDDQPHGDGSDDDGSDDDGTADRGSGDL